MNSNLYSTFDTQHIWHPYNKLPTPTYNPLVKSAKGSKIKLADNRELIDGMSSWWCTIHGYNHPYLNQAIENQLQDMAHIMFGGLTHQPAIDLAELLLNITPTCLTKIFFADSGSVAVEVALKMALQFWICKDKPEKNKFIALENAYHGDTFGAMAVCDPINGMHHLFANNLMQNIFAPKPDDSSQGKDIQQLEKIIQENHHQVAALILEPLVQGAGGMRFYRPEYLQAARKLCDEYNILLIADEIATGFGRTGNLFACATAQICPDIMCLGKALTGGYMTLAATLTTDEVSQTLSKTSLLMHGPTFMANPLACSVALASTKLLLESDWQNSVKQIENKIQHHFTELKNTQGVADIRVIGAIGVIELERNDLGQAVQEAAIEEGVWVRPFGKLVYIMPAFNIPADELDALCQGVVTAVKAVL